MTARGREYPAGSFNSKIRNRLEAVLAAAADAPGMEPVIPDLVRLFAEIQHMGEVIQRGDEIIEALVCEIADLTGASYCDIN